MAQPTLYRLAEECLRILSGGEPPLASNVTIPEIKIAIGQIANSLLKVDYFQSNVAMGETIPNGAMIGLYEGITFTPYGLGKSYATLPIRPLKLPREMGILSIFPSSQPDKEFIPLQMGQANLIRSQKLINDLLGQVGYEVYGNRVEFTKDLTKIMPNETLSMRLVIMDISLYDDYDPLPILPEMEIQIKQEVVKLFSQEPIADKIVDSSVKERKNTPINQQTQ